MEESLIYPMMRNKLLETNCNVREINFFEHFARAIVSAVARGGAGGARAPPVFFLKSKNRPV